MGFAQLSCELLGLKLQAAAKLPENDAKLQLFTVAKEIREALITLGLRKRKQGKKKLATVEEAKGKKKGK